MPNLTIRLTDAEREAWEDASYAEKRSLGNWIRMNCNAALTERGTDGAQETSRSNPAPGSSEPRSVSPEQPRMTASAYQKTLQPLGERIGSEKAAEPTISHVFKGQDKPFRSDFKGKK